MHVFTLQAAIGSLALKMAETQDSDWENYDRYIDLGTDVSL